MTNGPNCWVRIAAVLILGCVTLSIKAQGQVLPEERSSETACPSPAGPFPAISDHPAIHLEMAQQGGCSCDFWAMSCWFDCVFNGGNGNGPPTPGLDDCAQCKEWANQAYRTCLRKADVLVINSPAYHDAYIECQWEQRSALADCSASGPCNDV
jgi:uncharacterized Zn-finger protein